MITFLSLCAVVLFILFCFSTYNYELESRRRLRAERHLSQMKDAAESLWATLANVSGGDWTRQPHNWFEAAIRSRDHYHSVLRQDGTIWKISKPDCQKIVDALNYLREEEGDTVILFSDNPGFDGQPNRQIDCNGDWTNWADRRFGGDTLLEALEKAADEKRLYKSKVAGD